MLKLYKFLLFSMLLVLLRASLAGAAPSQRYDVVYTWDAQIQAVLDYRKKLAAPLELPVDSQLKIVGHGKEYGVVHTLNGTLAQAREAAGKQTEKLQRAGLKPARPIKSKDYHSLYNVSYTMGPNLEALNKDVPQIKNALGKQVGELLFIEQIDSKNYAIVYPCWGSRSAALRLAKQHGALLRKKKITPSIISAVNRPNVQAGSGLLSGTRRASDQQSSRMVPAQAPDLDTAQQQTAAPQTGLAGKQKRSKTKGQKPSELQLVTTGSGAGLNSRIDAFLQEQKQKGRIPQKERTAWVVYDLTNNTYVVSVNPYRRFQAASMIKPFVALAFFHQVEKGKLSYTPQHRLMMEDMIQHSSNAATNWFIRQVGGPARCEAILKKEYRQIFQMMKIQEYIPPGGRTYKNSAQPSEYIQFLKALWNSQLPYSKEMLRLMSLPGRDRIFCGTEVPSGTLVYNKTGSTAQLIGDMGILVPRCKNGGRAPYAIVGIVEGPSKAADYKQWMHTSGGVIRDFSTLVYEEMKQKHNLL